MDDFYYNILTWVVENKTLFKIYFAGFILVTIILSTFILRKFLNRIYTEPDKQDELHELISHRANAKMKRFYEWLFTLMFLAAIASDRLSPPEDPKFYLVMVIHIFYMLFIYSFVAEKYFKRQVSKKLTQA